MSPAAIALNRFGLGARPDDNPPADPRRWLIDQFDRFEPQPEAFGTLADPGSLLQRYHQRLQEIRRATDATGALAVDRNAADPDPADRHAAHRAAANSAIGNTTIANPDPAANTATSDGKTTMTADARTARQDARRQFAHDAHALYTDSVQARAQSALVTEAPFIERMVAFWSNHFCISADTPQLAAYAGAFERDAIRPHVLGRFADMLRAAEQHPAMLIYLNQTRSIGPDSPAAERAGQRDPGRRPGLNENLAREIMELHTLGVRSGYTQTDVTEFARALTGWTTDAADPDASIFRPGRHEPGPRTILGIRYDEPAAIQPEAVLAAFAAAPATASHIAGKLARHVAGDAPQPRLVARLAATFTASDGHLPSLYRTLIMSPEPWASTPKFKTPWDWTLSSLRGLGLVDAGTIPVASLQAQLGQPVWRPGSPAGWDDTAASWAAPDSLLHRVELATRLAAPFGDRLDARALAPRLLPGSLSAATATELARAESPTASLALLLVSPDFLRR